MSNALLEKPAAGKRIRHVVDNPYHLWAHQTYAETGENYASDRGASLFMDGSGSGTRRSFRGLIAYSYRTEMGMIVTNAKGERAYLLNVGDYSNTTSKHQGEIRSAIPGHEWTGEKWIDSATIFRITPDVPGTEPLTAVVRDPRAYIQSLFKRAARALEESTAPRLRPATREAHVARGAGYLADARALAKFFGVKVAVPADPQGAADAVAKVEKQKAAEAKRAEIQRAKDAAEAVAAWIAGTPGARVPYGLTTAYMRLNPNNPDEVQTSQGATVPTSHVRKAAPLILRTLRSGTPYVRYHYVPSNEGVHLGHYTLDRIDANGDVVVGCHRFERAEIERFAAVLGTAPEGETV